MTFGDMETKKPEKKPKILVTTELPKQEIRNVRDKEGEEYECITVEEALTELVNNIREIKKSL